MLTFYLIVVIFLLLLAVIDLSVGVSNDAVNFLNGAIGAKVAPIKTIIIIAAVGVFIGASLSNGMMDIARHGIYQPQHFYFPEIMTILLAVMLTDVVLLDVFNSLGMPTSTTVSLVFELLGATTAISIVKIASSHGALQFGDLLNTDKALTVIIAIFLSVAVAFIFGWIVQWITRLAFSFNYPKYSKYFVGIFGGLASTAIVYFMLIKGIKDASFVSDSLKSIVFNHMQIAVFVSFVFFTILMQALHWLKVNVLKVIVLMGTFSLALAFAANDLVNFVGVPLAGYSSFMDLLAQNGSVSPDSFLMEALCQPAKTPWYFLVGSGFVMVIVLATSKKAHLVVKRSNDLARQQEGIENFGTSQLAGVIVRTCTNVSSTLSSLVPEGIKQKVNERFNKNENPRSGVLIPRRSTAPAIWHARRSDSPRWAFRCATASRFTTGVTIFLTEAPSSPPCRASAQPTAASAWRSRPQAPSTAWPPKPSSRNTSPSRHRTCLPTCRASDRDRHTSRPPHAPTRSR
jgi:phosphate/sulfate permease